MRQFQIELQRIACVIRRAVVTVSATDFPDALFAASERADTAGLWENREVLETGDERAIDFAEVG